jgi:DNA processing protein
MQAHPFHGKPSPVRHATPSAAAIRASLRVAMAAGLGPATIARLRRHFGTDEAVCEATAAAVSGRLDLPPPDAASIVAALAAAEPWSEDRAMRRGAAVLLTPEHPAWPPLLRLLRPPPPALWCRGGLPASDRSVALVGSRRASAVAIRRTTAIAARLAAEGWTIVSGGALGVDAAAHRGAMLRGGRTIAVLGGGLDRPSPPSNVRLFEEIAASGGCLLSEWPMAVEPRPWHFPRRNRVIAGMARAVLVLAAGSRSGAHITARLAVEELGRDVGAVPGDPDDPAVAGCLRLLREGAAVIRDADDALELLESTEPLAAAARAAGEAAAVAPTQGVAATPSASRITMRSCSSRAGTEEPE